ncbi:hypothetical protein ACYZT7_04830 [Pseudomonas sp. RT4P38]
MAKTTDKPAADQSPAADLLLKFRDTVYTSRTLIIPETGRALPVAKGVVEVSASDEQALSYLKGNEEFKPLE